MPVYGSATAETSATVLNAHPVSVCQLGFGVYALHPEPVPSPACVNHTVSDHPRGVVAFARLVPPTPRTYCDDAGNSTPYAVSPALAVMSTPGWS